MCTAISVFKEHGRGFYFGRTMDISFSFGGKPVTVPRRYVFPETHGSPLTDHYAVTGMAAVVDGYPLFADGFNEAGLCIAALSFPKSAVYSPCPLAGKTNLASYELIPHVLGLCADVNEARKMLREVNIVDSCFRGDIPPSPLHWLISDGSQALAVEPTDRGLCVYDASAGVLTNEPPFPFHTVNLSFYQRLSARDQRDGETCHGLGAVGLPGDWSSPSRFVRADFLLRNFRHCQKDCEESRVADFFEILSAVAPPSGAVVTAAGEIHRAHYCCCMNPESGIYYLKRKEKLSVEVHAPSEMAKEGTAITL